MTPPAHSTFANALRLVRLARGLTQEDFDEVSSRVYISALERGLKQPTLRKVDEVAGRLEVHPLTLLVLSYVDHPAASDRLLRDVEAELTSLFPRS